MDERLLIMGIDSLSIAVLVFVLIFSVGVVWRVEKGLDRSYKLFVAAICALVAAQVTSLIFGAQTLLAILASKGLVFLGAAFFLWSVLLMRKIVRELDHEIPEKKQS